MSTAAAAARPSTSTLAPDARAAVRGVVAAGVASALSKSVVAPLDRVKLVYQLDGATTSAAAATTATTKAAKIARANYASALDCGRRLLVEQGARSLWRGNTASVARCMPSHALNFALRDYYRLVFVRDANARTQRARFVLGE